MNSLKRKAKLRRDRDNLFYDFITKFSICKLFWYPFKLLIIDFKIWNIK